MGIKSGRFTGRNGHEYEVALVGATVATDTIELGIPPATISMAAGEHKFCGFKSTTAMVNILTDAPLIELYSAGVTDIRLTITDTTTNSIEFDGYVTPFAFDQPYTGKNDSVTVNAVDVLTARKDTVYTNINAGNAYGEDIKAIAIVQHIAQSVGVNRLVVHINFNTVSDSNTSPLDIPVAQAGFLQDGMGVLDSLSAICQFFGYTATCVGGTLYLWDEHCLLYANQSNQYNCDVYECDEGDWNKVGHYYDELDSPIYSVQIGTKDILNDISVTIERAYDGIQITPEGSDTSVLLPDVCAEDNLTLIPDDDDTIGSGTRKANFNDGSETYRTPMLSTVLHTGLGTTGTPDGFPVNYENYGDYMLPDESVNGGARPWNVGSIPMRYVKGKTEKVDTELAAYAPTVEVESKNILWVRATSDNGKYAFKQRLGYSHTGGLAALSLSVIIANIEDYKMIESAGNLAWIPWVDVHVGNQHLGYGSASPYADETWVGEPVYHNAVSTSESGDVFASLRGADFLDFRKVFAIPNSSKPVMVDGYSHGVNWSVNYYVTKLEVVGVGDPIDVGHADMRHTYVKNASELIEVSTVLTTRKSGAQGMLVDGHRPYGVNARPSVVPAEKWVGGYMGRANEERIPISGILMEQLKARYAQPRICYKMTVDQNIKPFAAVYFGGNGYTVEAYDKDLYNSTTTITID